MTSVTPAPNLSAYPPRSVNRFDTRTWVSGMVFVGAVLGPIVGVRIAGANASLPFAVIAVAFVLMTRPPREPLFLAGLGLQGALILYGMFLVLLDGGTDVLGVIELSGLATGFLAIWIMGTSLEGGRLRPFLRLVRRVHVLALILAYTEFLSGVHLPSAFTEDYPNWPGPLLTLNNPNDVSTFFLFLTAMLMTETVLYRSVGRRTLAVLLPLDLAIVALGGARLALLGFAVVLGIFLIFVSRVGVFASETSREEIVTPVGRTLAMILLLTLAAAVALASGAAQNFTTIAVELETGGSTLMRWRVLLESVRMGADSYFLGIGPGQFETWMSGPQRTYYTWNTINPHNAGAEFFGQYGILGLACFVAIGALIVSGHFGQSAVARSTRAVCYINFTAILTVSVAASGFIETPLHWVYIGIGLAITAQIRRWNRSRTTVPARVQVPGQRATDWSTIGVSG